MRQVIFEDRHFDTIKKGSNYFSIERNGRELTSATTRSRAIKRVRLMGRVYNIGYSDAVYWENY